MAQSSQELPHNTSASSWASESGIILVCLRRDSVQVTEVRGHHGVKTLERVIQISFIPLQSTSNPEGNIVKYTVCDREDKRVV